MALHGIQWPSSNPKTLFVDYSNDVSILLIILFNDKVIAICLKQYSFKFSINSVYLQDELRKRLKENGPSLPPPSYEQPRRRVIIVHLE